jgi:hypothetical protein
VPCSTKQPLRLEHFQTTFQSTMPTSPNHALQRTRGSVTPAASSLRLSPTTQQSRPSRVSLSLGSLGASARLPESEPFVF